MERADDVTAARVPKQPSKVDAEPAEHDDYVDSDVAVESAAQAQPAVEAQPVVEAEPVSGLSERDEQILAFERQWWRRAGAKEQAIRDTFGLSTTRYYQLLNALLDAPSALAYDPVLVKRLRRLRAARTKSRGSTR
jgi:Protein of unknown function (DUF3263)